MRRIATAIGRLPACLPMHMELERSVVACHGADYGLRLHSRGPGAAMRGRCHLVGRACVQVPLACAAWLADRPMGLFLHCSYCMCICDMSSSSAALPCRARCDTCPVHLSSRVGKACPRRRPCHIGTSRHKHRMMGFARRTCMLQWRTPMRSLSTKPSTGRDEAGKGNVGGLSSLMCEMREAGRSPADVACGSSVLSPSCEGADAADAPALLSAGARNAATCTALGQCGQCPRGDSVGATRKRSAVIATPQGDVMLLLASPAQSYYRPLQRLVSAI